MLYDEGCCLYLSKNIVEIFHELSTSAESKYEKKFSQKLSANRYHLNLFQNFNYIGCLCFGMFSFTVVYHRLDPAVSKKTIRKYLYDNILSLLL